MSASATAFKAAGSTLSYKVSPASTYTELTTLIDINDDGVEVAEIDTTLLVSTVKTNIPGIPDSGGLTLTVRHVPSDATIIELMSLVNTPVVAAWQMQFADGSSPTTGSTRTFSAWVKSYAVKGVAIDGTPTADVNIRITGAITSTPGS